MRTRVMAVDPHNPNDEVLTMAAAVIRAGGLVAFPTETVYGLGADALNGEAVRSIFSAKGRPADNPLIVHIASADELHVVAEPSEAARQHVDRLARRFWPGPLTVVLPKRPNVPDVVSAGLPTVAVRMPDHPVALGLIRRADRPVAAPSANRSGRPSPTEAAHVHYDLDGRVDVIVDGGSTAIGLESTVLDLTVHPPVVHRPGAVTVEMLERVLGIPVHVGVETAQQTGADTASGLDATMANGPPPSPGVKYEHYAPRTQCMLVEGEASDVVATLAARLDDDRRAGRRAAVLATQEGAAVYGSKAAALCIAGGRDDAQEVAHNLYRCLRQLDETNIDIIYIEGIAPDGLGAAVMNRMRRASGHRILHKHKLD